MVARRLIIRAFYRDGLAVVVMKQGQVNRQDPIFELGYCVLNLRSTWKRDHSAAAYERRALIIPLRYLDHECELRQFDSNLIFSNSGKICGDRQVALRPPDPYAKTPQFGGESPESAPQVQFSRSEQLCGDRIRRW